MAYIYGASTYATINGSSAKKYEVRVGYEAQAYNIAGNTTPVNLTLEVRTIDANYGTWGFTQTSTLGGVTLGAKTFSVKTKNTWVTFATTTITVTHNADGTYSGSVSGSFTTNATDTYTLKSGSASVDMTLPTIPRATTPKINTTSLTMGSSASIALNPADSTFKHKLTYSFRGVANLTSGLSSGSDFTPSGNSTVTFTPPTSLADYIPNDLSGLLHIYCTTYDKNGNQISSPKSLPVTLNVPSYTPTVSVSIVGQNLCNGVYAEGKSYSVSTITASGKYGSSIQSYSTTVDGQTYTGDYFVTSELTSGTKAFVVKVKDSRGKEATNSSNTVTVYAYTSPSITSFAANRTGDETTVSARLVGSVSSVNGKNTSSLTITLNGITKTVTSGETVTFTGLSTDKTYEAIASVTDYYTTVSRSISISTVDVTMDFNASGKGIAFGKVSEKNAFEVDMPVEVFKTLDMKGNKILNAVIEGYDPSGSGDYEHPMYNTREEILDGNGIQLNWGSNFDVVDTLETDNGHVTVIGKERYKLPSSVRWEDIENPPFYKKENGDTLIWNGNTNGLEKTGNYYKVSTSTPTASDFDKGCTLYGFLNGEDVERDLTELIKAEQPKGYHQYNADILAMGLWVIVAYNDCTWLGNTFTKGTYFMYNPTSVVVTRLTIDEYTGFGIIKQLDSDFVDAYTKGETNTLIEDAKYELNTTITNERTDLHNEIVVAKNELNTKIDNTKTELNTAIENTNTELNAKIDDAKSELNGAIENTNTSLNGRIDSLDEKYAPKHEHDYLPITGGTIVSDSPTPLVLESTQNDFNFIGFNNRESNEIGRIGFYNGNPSVSVDNTVAEILHASNYESYITGFSKLDHTHLNATESQNGFMSASDKSKLDNIESFANNYLHPAYSSELNGLYKITVDAQGHVSEVNAVEKIDITALGIPAQDTVYTLPSATSSRLGGVKVGSNITNTSGTISLTKTNVTSALGYTPPTENTTYSNATKTSDGLMSSADKMKLDNIEVGAEKSVLREVSENLVSSNGTWMMIYYDAESNTNKQLYAPCVIDGKISRSLLSLVTTTEDGAMSSSDKVKLNGIEDGANKYVHPSTHDASMITQSATYRFVSDTEKSTWNNKASKSVATTSANGLMSKEDKSKLDSVADTFAPKEHTHNNYSLTSHKHDDYASKEHTHDGLMSSADKQKLDKFEDANNYALKTEIITYTLQLDGTELKLVGSDGSISSVTLPTTSANVETTDDGNGNVTISGDVGDDGDGNVTFEVTDNISME